MRTLIVILVTALVALLSGCATVANQTPSQALQAYCTVSTPEIAAFQASAAMFSPQVQTALAIVAPLNAMLCSPTSIAAATSGDVQTYVSRVLPPLTTIALEFAAIQSKAAKAMPEGSKAPILGVQ